MKLTLVASVLVAGATAFPAFNLVRPRGSVPAYSRKTSAAKYAAPSIKATNSSGSASVTDACNIGYCTQNGGTTGGAAGSQTTVTSLDELITAAGADGPAIIIVDGALTGSESVDVTSDKTIIGAAGSSLTGIGLRVKSQSNVIIRNMKIAKVLADAGDAIAIQLSTNVWVDHCDLSSDMDHGKDYYDGLCDITHAADYITVSNTHFHDHYKSSLVGHSDDNGDEDTGHLIITYANNYWSNVNSRGPSFRFGTGHIFNSFMENMDSAVNTRMGAEVLVESCAFSGVESAIMSKDSDTVGFATVTDVDLGEGTNTAEAGSQSISGVPYDYTLLGSANVQSSVTSTAGQTLNF